MLLLFHILRSICIHIDIFQTIACVTWKIYRCWWIENVWSWGIILKWAFDENGCLFVYVREWVFWFYVSIHINNSAGQQMAQPDVWIPTEAAELDTLSLKTEFNWITYVSVSYLCLEHNRSIYFLVSLRAKQNENAAAAQVSIVLQKN